LSRAKRGKNRLFDLDQTFRTKQLVRLIHQSKIGIILLRVR
jgi:hypothetical protein